MAVECFSSYMGEAMVAGPALEIYKDGIENPAPEGFKVARKGRNDKGVARGPRKAKTVKAVKVKGKRSPGRPRVFNGTQRRIIAAALRKEGLSKGIAWLEANRNLKISLTTARSVAEEFAIEFVQGRPVVKAA